MKWAVNISGDQNILQTLCDAGINDELFIIKENDEFVLKSIVFEKHASHTEVNKIACAYKNKNAHGEVGVFIWRVQ